MSRLVICLRLAFIIFVFTATSKSFAGSGFGDAQAPIIDEYVDLIELNNFYDPMGKPIYQQVLFYTINPATNNYEIREWKLVEFRETLHGHPLFDHKSKQWFSLIYDDTQKCLRRLRSKAFRQTWSQVDPERVNKNILPEQNRLKFILSHRAREKLKSIQESNEAPALEQPSRYVQSDNQLESLTNAPTISPVDDPIKD